MFPPAIARQLCHSGHDVVAVAADPRLRALSGADLYEWVCSNGRRVVTEIVRDFRPLVMGDGGSAGLGILLTSGRTFPRSRQVVGPLVAELDSWLCRPDAFRRPLED